MKSFVYLDEYKMYSLSSQIMEGVTDFIIKESRQSDSDVEEQKATFASGRKMAEIIETTSANVEKKFLHDYAYSIFEEKLVDLEKIIALSDVSSFDDIVSDSKGRRLVRIKAKANFLDASHILHSLNTLVDIQEAISIVAVNDRREKIIQEILSLGTSSSKKGALSALKSELESLGKAQLSKESVVNDRLHYKNLSTVLQHGFKGRLDIRMDLKDCKVTADLKRACLKDPEDFIFKTYSRVANVELVLLGVATQYIPSVTSGDAVGEGVVSDDTMSGIIGNTTRALNELEKHFTRVQGNQVVIDPIAVYLEL